MGCCSSRLRLRKASALEDCVLDFVGGASDLKAKLVRAIGEPSLRFAEDKLRMLRAVRFAARLGFEIEPRTMTAMRAQAAKIAQVSAERVRDELTRILTEGAARRGLELLDESGLLAAGAAGGRAAEGRGAASAISPRRRCVGAYADAAGASAGGCERDAGVGHAAARYRQARDVYAA